MVCGHLRNLENRYNNDLKSPILMTSEISYPLVMGPCLLINTQLRRPFEKSCHNRIGGNDIILCLLLCLGGGLVQGQLDTFVSGCQTGSKSRDGKDDLLPWC